MDFQDLKAKKVDSRDNYAKYEIFPFERGYGNSLATPLRRILLSSIPGTAITSVRIKGVDHEFSAVKGLKQDVLRLCLNLQSVVFKLNSSTSEKVILRIKGSKDKRNIYASDLMVPGNVTIVTSDILIAELDDKAELDLEATLETGYGFSMPDQDIRNDQPGLIPLSRDFSPVVRVNVTIENARVAQKTDFDKIVLEIWTNGAISPDEALKSSASVLFQYSSKLENVVSDLDNSSLVEESITTEER